MYILADQTPREPPRPRACSARPLEESLTHTSNVSNTCREIPRLFTYSAARYKESAGKDRERVSWCSRRGSGHRAPGISTQSNGRVRMRMRCAGGAEPGGRRSDRQLGPPLCRRSFSVPPVSLLPGPLFSPPSSPRPLFRGFHAYESV